LLARRAIFSAEHRPSGDTGDIIWTLVPPDFQPRKSGRRSHAQKL